MFSGCLVTRCKNSVACVDRLVDLDFVQIGKIDWVNFALNSARMELTPLCVKMANLVGDDFPLLTSHRRHLTKSWNGSTRRVLSSCRCGYFEFPSSVRMSSFTVLLVVFQFWSLHFCARNQNSLSACPAHIVWSAAVILHVNWSISIRWKICNCYLYARPQ